uniref:Uncharacterized protein n=1 Tax=Oryza nivara TaxID=4536 RepID=A0A0E0IEF0_ORYNI
MGGGRCARRHGGTPDPATVRRDRVLGGGTRGRPPGRTGNPRACGDVASLTPGSGSDRRGRRGLAVAGISIYSVHSCRKLEKNMRRLCQWWWCHWNAILDMSFVNVRRRRPTQGSTQDDHTTIDDRLRCGVRDVGWVWLGG